MHQTLIETFSPHFFLSIRIEDNVKGLMYLIFLFKRIEDNIKEFTITYTPFQPTEIC